jgi:hypothetical protein
VLLLPLVLVARMAMVNVPACVGVPNIKPVLALPCTPGAILQPEASAGVRQKPQTVGAFVAVAWYEKGLPTVPTAVKGLLMTGAPVCAIAAPGDDDRPISRAGPTRPCAPAIALTQATESRLRANFDM